MRVPNFLVIGAAKAGTTAVYDYLGEHPDVYMSPLKETNFLALTGRPLDFRGPGDDQYVNTMSITSLNAYCAQFGEVTTETAVGEACPLYLYDPQRTVIGNIQRYAPDATFIAILRHPVDRAYSAYLHCIRDDRETIHDFGRALEAEDQRIADHWEHIWHYRTMGYYGRQLHRYYDAFGPERIRVFLYKDLRTDPVGVLQDCYRFLGVDDSFVPEMRIRPNVTSDVPPEKRPPLTPEVRRWLIEEYEEDYRLLESLIHRDLSHWRE